jgi:tRNA dimethylallyltransferase
MHSGAIPAHGVLALFGPTAVGKTDVALALADTLRGAGRRPVAVSADALQVYRGLEVLTGVPPAAARARLEHLLVSIVPVDATFSVGQYAELAHAEIDALIEQGSTPIVVGGTGLYLRAALAELRLRPLPPDDVRRAWEAELELQGAGALHSRLAQRAPWAAEGIDPADRHRVVRAHALLDMGELEPPEGPNRLWTAETRRPTRLVGLVRDRGQLYERIDKRVLAMIDAGAAEEVRAAQAAGVSETARKALGFDELLAGDVDAMQRRTRNFAKRQLTWMRKLAGVELVDVTDREPADVAAAILSTPAAT